MIRNFCTRSGKNPNKNFYPDPNGKHRCTVCNNTFNRMQDLKACRTRMGYDDQKNRKTTKMTVRDSKLKKRKDMQDDLSKVKWVEMDENNSWMFKYLGSYFEAGGTHMPDLRILIASAVTRFGKLRQIWTDKDLHFNLRMRLYKVCICSVADDVWIRGMAAD